VPLPRVAPLQRTEPSQHRRSSRILGQALASPPHREPSSVALFQQVLDDLASQDMGGGHSIALVATMGVPRDLGRCFPRHQLPQGLFLEVTAVAMAAHPQAVTTACSALLQATSTLHREESILWKNLLDSGTLNTELDDFQVPGGKLSITMESFEESLLRFQQQQDSRSLLRHLSRAVLLSLSYDRRSRDRITLQYAPLVRASHQLLRVRPALSCAPDDETSGPWSPTPHSVLREWWTISPMTGLWWDKLHSAGSRHFSYSSRSMYLQQLAREPAASPQ